MQSKIYRILVGLMVFIPLTVQAQHDNSLNTFSPFTFYGLGDILPVGTTTTQSMGGIGVAYCSPYEMNLVNPAAYSQIPRQSSIFSFGASGRGIRLKTTEKKTFDNTFNFDNLAFMLPLGRGFGFAVSVTPFSSVGYATRIEETDPDIITDVGHVTYNYTGDGGVSQIKAGMGVRLFEGFSLGADLVTYLGTISRYSYEAITPVNGQSFRAVAESNKEEIAHISFDVGFQYNVWRTSNRMLTIGATYQPETSLRNKYKRQIYDVSASDSIYYNDYREKVTLPQKIAGGVYYQTVKFGIGLDYSFQDWKNTYRFAEADRVTLKEMQTVNFGMHYTPNRNDVRRFLNRWTYRAGFRYTDLYMKKDGQAMSEMAITLGVGIPLQQGSFSNLNVGLEIGQRGKTGLTPNGFPMVKEQYYRISLGVTLFDRNWFLKVKYY